MAREPMSSNMPGKKANFVIPYSEQNNSDQKRTTKARLKNAF